MSEAADSQRTGNANKRARDSTRQQHSQRRESKSSQSGATRRPASAASAQRQASEKKKFSIFESVGRAQRQRPHHSRRRRAMLRRQSTLATPRCVVPAVDVHRWRMHGADRAQRVAVNPAATRCVPNAHSCARARVHNERMHATATSHRQRDTIRVQERAHAQRTYRHRQSPTRVCERCALWPCAVCAVAAECRRPASSDAAAAAPSSSTHSRDRATAKRADCDVCSQRAIAHSHSFFFCELRAKIEI